MARSVILVVLVATNILLPLPIALFATGFFPYKPILRGSNQGLNAIPYDAPTAPFNKVIFMVVDALRRCNETAEAALDCQAYSNVSDFAFSEDSAFHYLHGLIRSGAAVPFTAYAAVPTITMPRIKALTTGSVPSFLDAILNFAESDDSSTLAGQDSWPLQLKSQQDGRLVMFGDNTWLKLFPGFFSRSDGTSSFFVSDFTEVDRNVTRNLPRELDMDDWNGAVLHYLGLDHIGHKTGPRSVHMHPKQEEMDGVVKTIFEALVAKPHLQSTLFVICGDHGMNDAGNHGGSSTGETSSALVFISPKLQNSFQGMQWPVKPTEAYRYFDLVEQLDVVPTLASLLGLPIPINNIGVLIPALLSIWPNATDQIFLLDQNIAQISRILSLTVGQDIFPSLAIERCTGENPNIPSLEHDLCHIEKLEQNVGASAQDKIEARLDFLRNAQTALSSATTNYSIPRLQLGVALATLLMLLGLVPIVSVRGTSKSSVLWICLVAFCQTASTFASSYVEEEQHIWHWLSGAWLVWLCLAASRRSTGLRHLIILAIFFSIRIQRRWNQTGQKHAGDPDIGRTFFSTQPYSLLVLVISVYYYISKGFTLRDLSFALNSLDKIARIPVVLAAIIFKLAFTKADAPELVPILHYLPSGLIDSLSLVFFARFVFGAIITFCVVAVLSNVTRNRVQKSTSRNLSSYIHAGLTLFLVTQTRINNIPLYLLFNTDLWLLRHLRLGADELTLSLLLYQHASFFVFGGSNAISSIDLANAYNGVDDFNVLAVGLLVFLSNWVGPAWWTFGLASDLARADRGAGDSLVRHTALLSCFNTTSVLATMLACFIFRSHLFVWTVFSPKYLYCIAWSICQHVLVNLCMGSFAYWIGLSRTRIGDR